jgi:hypothetical protein
MNTVINDEFEQILIVMKMENSITRPYELRLNVRYAIHLVRCGRTDKKFSQFMHCVFYMHYGFSSLLFITMFV